MAHIHISWVGITYLLLLFIPNILWTKNKPENYEIYAQHENSILSSLEKIGEAMVTCCVLILPNITILPLTARSCFFALSIIFMLLYEFSWFKYFRSSKTMQDFESSLLGIPVALASLPVIAFLLLALYTGNLLLGISAIILGIGHIGIHWTHKKQADSGIFDKEEDFEDDDIYPQFKSYYYHGKEDKTH